MASIDFHCFLGNASERQEELDEQVLLKDQILPGWRPLRLKEFFSRLWPFLPRQERPDNRLHVNQCLDSLRMTLSPRKSKRRSPIMDDQKHILFQSHRLEPCIKVALMIYKPVTTIGSGA